MAATFFIPSGHYQLDATGSPIAGSFQNIKSPLDLHGRVRDLLLAGADGGHDRLHVVVRETRQVRSGAVAGRHRCRGYGAGPADAKYPDLLIARHILIIALVGLTFALLTFAIIPWGAILGNAAVDPCTHETINSPFAWELGWWLPELSALFFVMAIVVGVVGGLGESGTTKAFISGVIDFTGPAFLVVVARGVSVITINTKTIDTVLHVMEGRLRPVRQVFPAAHGHPARDHPGRAAARRRALTRYRTWHPAGCSGFGARLLVHLATGLRSPSAA